MAGGKADDVLLSLGELLSRGHAIARRRHSVKTSARNQFPGKVVSVEKGSVGAIVKIDTDSPCRVTAYITKEAVEDLGLKKGDRVVAIVKSTEVMVGKD